MVEFNGRDYLAAIGAQGDARDYTDDDVFVLDLRLVGLQAISSLEADMNDRPGIHRVMDDHR